MKSNQIVVSFSQFAFGLGKQGRMLSESTLVWHLEYAKANEATRKARLQEWLVQHLMGGLDVTQQVAERILSTPRTRRSHDNNKAYSKAYSDFRYHIIRKPKGRVQPATSGTAVSSQQDIVEQALALVESMTKAQQSKFRTRITWKK